MLETFKEISKEEDCELKVNYESSFSQLITFSPFLDENEGKRIKSLLLQIKYRNQIIQVLNKTGDTNLGEIKCNLSKGTELAEFKVTNRNRLLRLVNRKINLLKINCAEKKVEGYIQDKLLDSKLEEIARSSQFEPIIIGIQKDSFEITTNYSLVFSRKNDVIRPLIKFYKSLIDFKMN